MNFDDLDDVLSKTKEDLSSDAARIASALGQSDNTGEASQEQCKKVLTRISKESGDQTIILPQHVMFATTCLLQRGATSPRTPAATKMIFGTATVTVDLVRKACREERLTVRQFARGMKDRIADIMLAMGEQAPEGNLAKSFKLETRNVTHEEAIWASDFQTYNNRCPSRVKNWLVKNYRERFRK